MDWLKKRIQSLSLKKALMLYIAVAAIAIILCFLVTSSILNGWSKLLQQRLISRNQIVSYRAYDYEGKNFTIQYSAQETFSTQVLKFFRTWSVFFYSIGGIMVTAVLFYNQRLKAPLEVLRKEAEQIGRGNLDYECSCDSRDEMGELCNVFNNMRLQLGENYREIWSLMEQQRKLNAAFAHDLRTPLTVLRGYTDFLSTYYPKAELRRNSSAII